MGELPPICPPYLDDIASPQVDGVLLDIGLSSRFNWPMPTADSASPPTDAGSPLRRQRRSPRRDLINRLGEQELADLIFRYGEERQQPRIARSIVERRRERPFTNAHGVGRCGRRVRYRIRPILVESTGDANVSGVAYRRERRARRLGNRFSATPAAHSAGGRVGIISFHSLEDAS